MTPVQLLFDVCEELDHLYDRPHYGCRGGDCDDCRLYVRLSLAVEALKRDNLPRAAEYLEDAARLDERLADLCGEAVRLSETAALRGQLDYLELQARADVLCGVRYDGSLYDQIWETCLELNRLSNV